MKLLIRQDTNVFANRDMRNTHKHPIKMNASSNALRIKYYLPTNFYANVPTAIKETQQLVNVNK